MEGDPLGDILALASARCVRIGTLRAGGTWALRFSPLQKIKLNAVVKGACWLAVDGEHPPVRLETGDVFVVPAARPFVVACACALRRKRLTLTLRMSGCSQDSWMAGNSAQPVWLLEFQSAATSIAPLAVVTRRNSCWSRLPE